MQDPQRQDGTVPTRSSRPEFMGYLQVAVIGVILVAIIYLAQAPEPVEYVPDDALTGSASSRNVVVVAQPQDATRQLSVRLTGNVIADREVRILSDVVGRISWISPDFRNGGFIRANEPFLKIDPAEQELEVERTQNAVRVADARLLAARTVREGSTEVEEAILSEAESLHELARLRLERTEFSLPYDARVIRADAGIGKLVGPVHLVGTNASMGTVYQSNSVRVLAPVTQEDLEYLSPVIGRTAKVTAREGTFEAEVETISAVLAADSRLGSLFLKFVDLEKALPLPGSFAEIEIVGPEIENAYVLPEEAFGEGNRVWIARDGVLESVSVDIIGKTDFGTIVNQFDAGSGVVVSTIAEPRDGLAIAVSETN